jgi:hypothetical protein
MMMILLHQNKKRREQGKKCHDRTMMHSKKRGKGMKDHVDKSMGIVTHIAEALARIKPTEPLRLVKREARKKRNCSDSSGNSPAKILSSRCVLRKAVVQSPHRRDPK